MADASYQRRLARELAWAHRYDAFGRIARTPEHLEELLAPLRREVAGGWAVPDWVGVDLLKAWAFLLARSDHHSGGYELEDPESQLSREWRSVLDRLAVHPDARGADRPPGYAEPTLTLHPATEPRSHRDPAVLAAKQARWREKHVAPIQMLCDEIATAVGADVPRVDPDSGGVFARVLFVLEAPARAAAHDSGMLSADNDDLTAKHVFEAYQVSGLPREWALHWNVVPWYVGTPGRIRAVTAEETIQGIAWTRRLVDLLPDLRVVVAFGKPASAAVPLLDDVLDARGITRLSCIHPSPRNYNTPSRHAREKVEAAFAEAYRHAQN